MTPPHRRGWRARCGRAGRRLSHSLKWRLVGLFLLLALATTITFIAGVHRMLDAAWDGYGRPLTTDYLDLLTAEIGNWSVSAFARSMSGGVPTCAASRSR